MRDSVKSLEVGHASFEDEDFGLCGAHSPDTSGGQCLRCGATLARVIPKDTMSKGTSRQLSWGSVIVTIPPTPRS